MEFDVTHPFQLIFLDVDGTLVGADDIVSPRTLASLEAARHLGCTIVICTARSRFTAKHIAAQLSGHGYGIFSNGAVISDWETGRVLAKISLPSAITQEAARLAHASQAAPLCFGVRVDDDGGQSVYTDRTRALFPSYEALELSRIVFLDDPVEYANINPVIVSVNGEEHETRLLSHTWREALGLEVTVHHTPDAKYGYWCSYLHASAANKGNAARTIAAMLGVPREQVMAVGDHLNDLELIQWTGLGICMGDGHAEVLAKADYVTGALAEEGVAQAIERFVLGNETRANTSVDTSFLL